MIVRYEILSSFKKKDYIQKDICAFRKLFHKDKMSV